MTRGHLLQRLLLPLTLLAAALVAISFSATKAHETNSNLKSNPDNSVQNGATTSVSTDQAPSVTVDGTQVPIKEGHSKFDLGNNRNVDVTVNGDTLTVNQNQASDTNSSSVQINVESSGSSNSSTNTSVHSSGGTQTESSSTVKVKVRGNGSATSN